MTRETRSDKPETAPASREERLKAALKANIARRMAQARARADGGRGADDGKTDTDT